MKIKELKQTTQACPSQWEGTMEDGKFIYIRFRWGVLSVGIGKDEAEAVNNSSTNMYYNKKVSDDLDGVMSTEEMLKLIGPEFIK